MISSYIFRSTGNDGAPWSFPAREIFGTFTQNPAILNDKQYMTVYNHVGSPFQDRVYVIFAADGSSYIYEAHSSDMVRASAHPSSSAPCIILLRKI